MENERRVQQKAPASRYALLDELRGLDLVSMMLYHACWDMMFLFGIWMDWYYRLAGAAVAAEHLLGVHPAVRLLRAAGTPHPEARRTGVCCRGTGHGGDAGLHAGGPGGVRCADLSGQRHAAHRCAGTAAEKDPARRRAGGFGGAVCTDLSSGRALARLRRAAPCVAGCMVRELLYSVFRLSALRFLFHRLFCPAAVAVFVLGGGTTCTRRWAGRGWNRCAVRSARRWAGWAGTRFCCICCTSR